MPFFQLSFNYLSITFELYFLYLTISNFQCYFMFQYKWMTLRADVQRIQRKAGSIEWLLD